MFDPIAAHLKRMADSGFQHEKAAQMKLYAQQARYVPLPKDRPDYLKRLMDNKVPQLDMKPGGKMTNLYSNTRDTTLDDKFSRIYTAPKKLLYKLRPIENAYKSPNIASAYSSSLEDTAIGYQ